MGRGGENFENFECCLKSMVYGSRVPKVLDLYHVCMYVNHYKQRVCGHVQSCPHIPFFWNSKEIIMMENEYGTVSFTWHDITASKPKWKQDRCEAFLGQHEEELYEVMLDAGWEFLKSNLNEKEKK
jgi:hypothetical protein